MAAGALPPSSGGPDAALAVPLATGACFAGAASMASGAGGEPSSVSIGTEVLRRVLVGSPIVTPEVDAEAGVGAGSLAGLRTVAAATIGDGSVAVGVCSAPAAALASVVPPSLCQSPRAPPAVLFVGATGAAAWPLAEAGSAAATVVLSAAAAEEAWPPVLLVTAAVALVVPVTLASPVVSGAASAAAFALESPPVVRGVALRLLALGVASGVALPPLVVFGAAFTFAAPVEFVLELVALGAAFAVPAEFVLELAVFVDPPV